MRSTEYLLLLALDCDGDVEAEAEDECDTVCVRLGACKGVDESWYGDDSVDV